MVSQLKDSFTTIDLAFHLLFDIYPKFVLHKGNLIIPPLFCISDVFHWYCLNKYAQQMPPNTAPAGYVCPCCKSSLFPAQNVTSPVAEALRQYLSKVNWARAGLGLPLVSELLVCVRIFKFQRYKL